MWWSACNAAEVNFFSQNCVGSTKNRPDVVDTADIFKNNAMNVGILPVTVSEGFLHKIFTAIELDPQSQIEVDLPAQTVTIISTNEKGSFEINGYKKHNLLNGFDDIDFLYKISSEIKMFADKTVY